MLLGAEHRPCLNTSARPSKGYSRCFRKARWRWHSSRGGFVPCRHGRRRRRWFKSPTRTPKLIGVASRHGLYGRSMARRSRRDVKITRKPVAQDPRPSRSVEPFTSVHGPFATQQHFGNGVSWSDAQLNSRERPPTRESPALLGTDHATARWHGH